jgi:hypothetical protein
VVTDGQLLAQITVPAGVKSQKKKAPSLGAKTIIWSPNMDSIVNYDEAVHHPVKGLKRMLKSKEHTPHMARARCVEARTSSAGSRMMLVLPGRIFDSINFSRIFPACSPIFWLC